VWMEDALVTKHDILFKKSLENPKVAYDFFSAHLPAFLKEKIDLTTLKAEKGTYINNAYKHLHTDMLFSVKINNQEGFIYLLTEHQSSPDKKMPLRMLEYIPIPLQDANLMFSRV